MFAKQTSGLDGEWDKPGFWETSEAKSDRIFPIGPKALLTTRKKLQKLLIVFTERS